MLLLTLALMMGGCSGDQGAFGANGFSSLNLFGTNDVASDQGERWSGDSWPLTVDAGVLGCEGGDGMDNSVWFEVKGVRYGISGFMVSHYRPIRPILAADPELPVLMDDPKGEGVIESGEFLKKNIGVLLNPGLELC